MSEILEESSSSDLSDNEVVSNKKRKLEEFKAKVKQHKISGESKPEVSLPLSDSLNSPEKQLSLLVKHQESSTCCESFGNDNIFTINNTCPSTLIESLNASGLKKMLKDGGFHPGCPVAIVVTSSANRATDLIGVISNKFHCRVAKLFSRHMKIEDQIETLKQTQPVAVGTPNRISKLIEVGALSLSYCSMVILDVTPDPIKQFTLLTWPETKRDTYDLLNSLIPAVENVTKLLLINEPQAKKKKSGKIRNIHGKPGKPTGKR